MRMFCDVWHAWPFHQHAQQSQHVTTLATTPLNSGWWARMSGRGKGGKCAAKGKSYEKGRSPGKSLGLGTLLEHLENVPHSDLQVYKQFSTSKIIQRCHQNNEQQYIAILPSNCCRNELFIALMCCLIRSTCIERCASGRLFWAQEQQGIVTHSMRQGSRHCIWWMQKAACFSHVKPAKIEKSMRLFGPSHLERSTSFAKFCCLIFLAGPYVRSICNILW